VTVLGDRRSGVTEIVPQGDWYDSHAKYVDPEARPLVDVDLAEAVTLRR